MSWVSGSRYPTVTKHLFEPLLQCGSGSEDYAIGLGGLAADIMERSRRWPRSLNAAFPPLPIGIDMRPCRLELARRSPADFDSSRAKLLSPSSRGTWASEATGEELAASEASFERRCLDYGIKVTPSSITICRPPHASACAPASPGAGRDPSARPKDRGKPPSRAAVPCLRRPEVRPAFRRRSMKLPAARERSGAVCTRPSSRPSR